MANEYVRTRVFRDASFRNVDLHGATFRECDLQAVRIIGCGVDDLRIDAFAGELGTVDVWMGRMLPEVPEPFQPIGLPPGDHPEQDLIDLGIDIAAIPSYAEVSAVFDAQLARTRRSLDEVSDGDLDRMRTAVPMPVWGEESHSVGACFQVVLNELCEHRRYAVRDLAVLEAR